MKEKNTIIVVIVEDNTGRKTTLDPSTAASLRLKPLSLYLRILSKTTTALSTNSPNPNAKPDKVNMFNGIFKI